MVIKRERTFEAHVMQIIKAGTDWMEWCAPVTPTTWKAEMKEE